MPVSFLSSAQSDNYAKYPIDLPSDIVDSLFFLDDHDLEWIASKRGDFSRLGYALQLTTVRFIGAFITEQPFSLIAIYSQYWLNKIISTVIL